MLGTFQDGMDRRRTRSDARRWSKVGYAGNSMPAYVLLLALAGALVPLDQVNDLRCSVCRVGDVDGDGVADFALARRGWGPTETFVEPGPELGGPGVVWIVSSKTGQPLKVLKPEADDPSFGRALEAIGDLDGDRQADLLVAGSKVVWAYSSATGEVLHAWRWPRPSKDFGLSLSAGGDVDGDSVDDVAIFLRERAADGDISIVAIYSGKTGKWIRDFVGLAAHGSHVDLGERELLPALALVPDRDGDARADLALVVARGGDEPEPALLVVSSRDGAVLHRARLADTDTRPWLIRDLGDVDGDGKPEILASFLSVRVAVLSGADGSLVHEHDYRGAYENGEGSSLSNVGDLDGDGAADYLVAANEDGLDCDPGFACVFSGKSGKILRSQVFEYHDKACGAGVDACAIGDVDGDAIRDFVLHMPRLREVRVVSGVEFWTVLTRIDLRVAPFSD
jgi:hypothetical protein